MIVNTGLKRFSIDGRSGGHRATFVSNLMNGTILASRGTAPTFTRATVATVTDQDLVVRQVLSGEARFGGFRRVYNQSQASDNLLHPNWAGTNGATATATAITLVNTNSSYRWALIGFNTKGTFVVSFVASSTTPQTIVFEVLDNADGSDAVSASIPITATPTRYSIIANYSASATFSGALGFQINRINTVIAGTVLQLSSYQVEDVTGQSNQNPGDRVSVGVLTAPYQGAGVDGVRYFPYLNGNTVASNVVTEATGAAISSSILGGYLPEPAATDLLTARADARDMTTANWTLGATMTRARTSTGADGVANKATRLTGGAVAATNIITTTITAAASSRTYSVLIKRVTGTGTVLITQDNFATTADVTALINSSTFTLVQMVQSQLNAVLGIKISTNGDAIDADWNQFSAGDLTGLINSRIPDTITTRNADVLTYATTGWLNAAAGTLYAEWFNPTTTSGDLEIASINDTTTNNFVDILHPNGSNTNTTVRVFSGGAAQSNFGAAAVTAGAVAKAVNVYQVNDFAGYANNTSLGTDISGTIPTMTQLQIGNIIGVNTLGHYVRAVSYYPVRMQNNAAKALTA